jgi:hypothetical protein
MPEQKLGRSVTWRWRLCWWMLVVKIHLVVLEAA